MRHRRPALPKLSSTGLPRLASICNPFKINTSESVSKQTSLTTFRINTYAKTRGEGSLLFFWSRHSSLATVSCFHSLTTVKLCNPLVFKTIRNARGCTYPLPPLLHRYGSLITHHVPATPLEATLVSPSQLLILNDLHKC